MWVSTLQNNYVPIRITTTTVLRIEVTGTKVVALHYRRMDTTWLPGKDCHLETLVFESTFETSLSLSTDSSLRGTIPTTKDALEGVEDAPRDRKTGTLQLLPVLASRKVLQLIILWTLGDRSVSPPFEAPATHR